MSIEDQISDHAILNIDIHGHNENLIIKKRKIQIWSNYNEIDLWQHIENSLHSWWVIESADVNTKMNWLIHILRGDTDQFKNLKKLPQNAIISTVNLNKCDVKKIVCIK